MGTRGSDLARTQTEAVIAQLQAKYPELGVEVRVIRTKGDIMQDVALAKIGGKGFFVKEIEEALLRGEIDLAVHSMKDMPVGFPAGLLIGAMPAREDPRDVLISKDRLKIEELPQRARLGTGSLRRRLQLARLLPDVVVVPLRGNIDTRIRKIEREALDGVILAAAGMRRMGRVQQVAQFIPVEVLLPAVGQGALGIEVRRDDDETRALIAFLDHPPTRAQVGAERAFLQRLGGGCQLPVAAYAEWRGGELAMCALLGNPDGTYIIQEEQRAPTADGERLGREVAERILGRGGRQILAELYESC